MERLFALVLAFSSASAFAAGDDLGDYNRGLQAFNSADYDTAARVFYELEQNADNGDVRAKSQYYVADSFLRKGLPISALIYFANIVKDGPKHPFYLKAVEGMVNVQKVLGDEYLIPSTLDREYNDAWATLPPEVLARINYLVGMVDLRKKKFDEAKSFLESVGSETDIYAKAQYLLGVTLADPLYPGGAKGEAATKAFEHVVKLAAGGATRQLDFQQTRELAMLSLGRTYYGLQQYQKATEWYERIPRFSKYWDQALFENGWARYQNDDLGGALGSLQSLHAPQFASAFQPESWTLKATVYYFSCLFEETKAALKSFEDIYLPIQDKLKPLVVAGGANKDNDFYYKLVSEDSEQVPRAVLLWAHNNERLLGVVRMIKQIDTEEAILNANEAWRPAKIAPAMTTYLDSNRATLTKVAGQNVKNLLGQAYYGIKGFADNAEIIRFETSKAEKEIFETGVDQKRLLAQKSLYRPSIPAENWNYWKFEGEFWIDEIGYYQYTLKKGCPANRQ
jgi:tetratricopeptide (TPR) repeat protein